MNWMTDKSEYLTTKLEYSGSSASWSAEGNLLANTVTSVPSGAVGSPWIVSYSVNGYVADHNGSLNLNYLDRDLSARVDSDGRFSVSAGNNWTKPIVIDYVIQQGNSTLASQAIITSGKLPQTPDVLPPAHYIGNNPSGIAGHAREGTETGNKLVSFTVKPPTAKPPAMPPAVSLIWPVASALCKYAPTALSNSNRKPAIPVMYPKSPPRFWMQTAKRLPAPSS